MWGMEVWSCGVLHFCCTPLQTSDGSAGCILVVLSLWAGPCSSAVLSLEILRLFKAPRAVLSSGPFPFPPPRCPREPRWLSAGVACVVGELQEGEPSSGARMLEEK